MPRTDFSNTVYYVDPRDGEIEKDTLEGLLKEFWLPYARRNTLEHALIAMGNQSRDNVPMPHDSREEAELDKRENGL
jgi:hypothetical protein